MKLSEEQMHFLRIGFLIGSLSNAGFNVHSITDEHGNYTQGFEMWIEDYGYEMLVKRSWTIS